MNFDQAIAAFTAALNTLWNADCSEINRSHVEAEYGKKYVRIVRADDRGSSRSAYAFVSMETGEIFKPASYKAPARHARGNIYNPNPIQGCGVHSVDYLR